MDRARPGTWFTRGELDYGVDDIQFDCCKARFNASVHSVRAFRHCPFCGCKLTNQRAVRPRGISASMWKGTLGTTSNAGRFQASPGTITPPTYSEQYLAQPYWVIERMCDHGYAVGDWSEYSRVFPRYDMSYRLTALTELQQAVIDAKEDYPWCDEHFRLVYRTADRVIGVVQRPNWFVEKFISKETAE